MASGTKVVFVYNAQSGVFSALSDYVHKLVSPDTYACQLCAVTYGNLGMRSTWKHYVEDLPAKVVFTYQDRVRDRPMMKNAELPAAFVITDDETKLVISAEAMNRCQSEAELIALCREKIEPLL